MIRLLGFLVGSLMSILVILLLVGVPTLNLDDRKEAQQRYDTAIEMLRAKQQELEDAIVVDAVPSEPEVTDGAPPNPVLAPDAPLPVAEPHWFSFWNPFRSEIAASGFVARLESVTGLDYRVVRVKPGVYEVAFAYYDDAEKDQKLAQISAATGLSLPGS